MKLKRNSRNSLKWKVYKSDFNHHKIEEINIFDYSLITDEIVKIFKEVEDFTTFKGEIKKELMYHFWSRCEYEIILSEWPCKDTASDLKIDIYDQICLNFDVFAKYVWDTLLGNYEYAR